MRVGDYPIGGAASTTQLRRPSRAASAPTSVLEHDAPLTSRIQRQLDGKRRRKKARRNNHASGGPLLEAIVSFHGNAPVKKVLSVLGSDIEGLMWQSLIAKGATHMHFSTCVLSEQPLRDEEHPCARAFVLTCLRLLNDLERHGERKHKISVVGKRAWFGKTYRVRTEEELAELRQKRADEFEFHGVVHTKPIPLRAHVPAREAHGLASRIKRGPRQLMRYAAAAKLLGLFVCFQPRRDANDAVWPLKGNYPYPEWTILRRLPGRLLAALRASWAEIKGSGKCRTYDAPVRRGPRSSCTRHAPTGPPAARPGATGLAAADERLIADIFPE